MIPSTVDLAKAPHSVVLTSLRDALFAHADQVRSFEESFVRAGFYSGWSEGGEKRYRGLRAAAAIVEHAIAAGMDAAVRKRAAPDWVTETAGQVRAAMMAPLPTPSVSEDAAS